MSIFDKIFPPRSMDPINKEQDMQEKGLSGWSVKTYGGKEATFFDVSDYEVLTKGYNTNPYVYAVVNKLAFLMAMVPMKVSKVVDKQKQAKYKSLSWEEKITPKGERIKEESLEDAPEHELQQLLDNPNGEYGAFEFRQSYYINKLSTGNMYIEALKPTDSRPPTELYNLPPLSVTINPTNNFYDKVEQYFFNWGATAKDIEPEKVLHSKYYNPLGRIYGLSPLSAARRATQSINDGDEWNASLLQNGAKPEYVIITANGTTPEQKTKLKKRFMDQYAGPHKQTSEPLVVDEDFMKFESLGYNMRDMDWVNANLTNMRKVYDVYGVSSEIFNDPTNKTQANKREAIRSLYTDRVLPEVEAVKDEFERWLKPMYPDSENITLVCDTSSVDALNEEQDKIAERLERIDYYTPNEKRAEMGKERIDEEWADMVYMPANKVPAQSVGTMSEPLEEAKDIYNFEKVELNGHG